MLPIIEKTVAFHDNADGLLIEHTQDIPSEFLDTLAVKRAASLSTPMGDFCHIASIPEVLVDQWRREGFDILVEPVRDVVARLKRTDLSKFLATEKTV